MPIARYPIDIYGTGIQRFFTFVVPLAFVATDPVHVSWLLANVTVPALALVEALTAVAEPETYALMLVGLGALGGWRRRHSALA